VRAQGLDEILVVEEKRQIVEYQLKEQLYNWRDDVRPRVIGKFDEKGEWVAPRGEWLLTSKADFSVASGRVIASRVSRLISDPSPATTSKPSEPSSMPRMRF
jgi:indolepyruvate ferredoxin oxidoreductase